MPILRTTLAAAMLALCSSTFAHEFQVGNLRILHPHAKPTLPGQSNGAAYIGIINTGNAPDRLLAVSVPIAASADLHRTTVDGNIVKMREALAIDIAPTTTIKMMPGSGYHIMLTKLKTPLNPGDKFPMTLTFEKAGKAEVSVSVDKTGQEAPPSSPEHRH